MKQINIRDLSQEELHRFSVAKQMLSSFLGTKCSQRMLLSVLLDCFEKEFSIEIEYSRKRIKALKSLFPEIFNDKSDNQGVDNGEKTNQFPAQ